jgi:hypothetical protein
VVPEKAADAVIGGWQLTTVYSWQSGLPFTPSYRDCNADRDTGWCRPDVIGNWKPAEPTRDQWFITTPLTNGQATPMTTNGQSLGPWRRPQRGVFGNVGRNRLLGPSFQQFDMALAEDLQHHGEVQGAVPRRGLQCAEPGQSG